MQFNSKILGLVLQQALTTPTITTWATRGSVDVARWVEMKTWVEPHQILEMGRTTSAFEEAYLVTSKAVMDDSKIQIRRIWSSLVTKFSKILNRVLSWLVRTLYTWNADLNILNTTTNGICLSLSSTLTIRVVPWSRMKIQRILQFRTSTLLRLALHKLKMDGMAIIHNNPKVTYLIVKAPQV